MQAGQGKALEWERIREYFHRAVELEPAEREIYLQAACGDDVLLRAEVRALLLEHDRASGLLAIGPSAVDDNRFVLSPGDCLAGRFEIIRPLGAGGMGEVYEAHDRELGAQVALKTLRPELLHDPKNRERFKHEILNGHKVTHANICRIYDLAMDYSKEGAFLAFTMELLDGETLAAYLERQPDKRLSVEVALPLVRQMAAGLEALHGQDIVHRDFKPSNVILVGQGDSTQVKITDFGLARCTEAPGQTLSGSRDLVGTPIYMAPEQLTGDRDKLSPATDVYALGLVLYEMVTGTRAYPAESLVENAIQKTAGPPKPPREHVPDLDERWDRVIVHCLERSPENRPGDVSRIADALEGKIELVPVPKPVPRRRRLRRLTSIGVESPAAVAAFAAVLLALLFGLSRYVVIEGFNSAATERRVAFLPIASPGGDEELQATADGLTETITLRLSEYEAGKGKLLLAPASEVRRLKVDEAGEALKEFDSNYVVQSILQKQDDRIELSFSLIDTEGMNQVNSAVVRSSVRDALGLQEQAVAAVAKMLDARPGPDGIAPDVAPRAYGAYLSGVGFLTRFDVEGNLGRAIAAFEKALSYDSDHAPAHAGLAEAYLRQADETRTPALYERAKKSAERAVELDDMLAYARVMLGVACQKTGDPDRAGRELNEAIKLDPLNGDAHRELAKVYQSQGKTEEAEREFEKVEPKDWKLFAERGAFYFHTGRHEEAAVDFKAVTEENPDSIRGFLSLGGVYIAMGRYAEAAQQFQRALLIRPDPRIYSNLGASLYYQGLFEEAAAAFKKAANAEGNRYIALGNLGDALHWSSKKQEAADSFEKAIALAEEVLAVNPSDARVRARIAVYRAKLGRCDQARQSLSRALDLAKNDSTIQGWGALVYELCGERGTALTLLRQAIKGGYSLTDIEHDPWFAELRRNERYPDIVLK